MIFEPPISLIIRVKCLMSASFLRLCIKISNDESNSEDEDNKWETNNKGNGASLFPEPESLLHTVPTHMALVDRETGTQQLAVHLRQPFSTLLLVPKVEDQHIVVYKLDFLSKKQSSSTPLATLTVPSCSVPYLDYPSYGSQCLASQLT